MTGTAIVLQARMGSTRLSGKVMEPIGRVSILEHCIARLQSSGLPVIVATTSGPDDDVVAGVARTAGADVYRGAAHDVLARYRGAAREFTLERVIRATADNPFVDPDAVRRVIAFQHRCDADHVVECGLPLGAAVEAVTADALDRASSLVTDPYDREHVTSFIRRDARFRALRAVAPGNVRRPGLRLTVDTPADLAFVREIHARLASGDHEPALADVIQAADAILIRSVARQRVRQGA